MTVPPGHQEAGPSGDAGSVPADAALQVWLQRLREMHRPEEEAVLLDM